MGFIFSVLGANVAIVLLMIFYFFGYLFCFKNIFRKTYDSIKIVGYKDGKIGYSTIDTFDKCVNTFANLFYPLFIPFMFVRYVFENIFKLVGFLITQGFILCDTIIPRLSTKED